MFLLKLMQEDGLLSDLPPDKKSNPLHTDEGVLL